MPGILKNAFQFTIIKYIFYIYLSNKIRSDVCVVAIQICSRSRRKTNEQKKVF